MKTLVLATIYAGVFGLPWVGGHGAGHPPRPVSVGERRAMEDHVHDRPDFPLKYAGRPFSTMGNAYKAPLERNPLSFTETRTFGADVFCSNVAGPIIYGEQIKVSGILQSPVFTWDEGTKTFYLKDCVLSR
jgi:hypothetical protein